MALLRLILALVTITTCQAIVINQSPQLRFAWSQIDYVWDSPSDRENAIASGQFIQENNLVLGLVRWRNKLFVTVPKWKKGVASSLNYIDVDGPQDQPLRPYPSMKDNLIADDATELPSESSIVSVFRLFVDPCDRLWVVDTGTTELNSDQPHKVVGPSLVIFDLNTDQLLHRYFFKDADTKADSILPNIVVDVDEDTCDDAYAYIPDLGAFGLIIYSLKQDKSVRVEHESFRHEPEATTFNIGGVQFDWTDGVFGLALTEPCDEGYRTLYYHAFSSTKEYYVSTKILHDYINNDNYEASSEFKLLGDRGPNTQASLSYYDPETNVIFYTQVNRDGVACWNLDKPYTPENNPLIFSDATLYEFFNDLKIDDESTLWLLSDRMPRFLYGSIDPNDINYRIFSIDTAAAIAGTTCE